MPPPQQIRFCGRKEISAEMGRSTASSIRPDTNPVLSDKICRSCCFYYFMLCFSLLSSSDLPSFFLRSRPRRSSSLLSANLSIIHHTEWRKNDNRTRVYVCIRQIAEELKPNSAKYILLGGRSFWCHGREKGELSPVKIEERSLLSSAKKNCDRMNSFLSLSFSSMKS